MEMELWLLWATLAVVLLWATRRAGRTGRMPPGPMPLPVIGNMLNLRGNLHHTLARLARAHGPVMTLKLGLITAVVVSSRDAAGEAFANHDRRLAARVVPDAARALGFSDRTMIWLPSSDPLWKSLRGIVANNVLSPRGLAEWAGSDPMAITIEWAMAELLRNPSVMAKVCAEIQNALGGKEAIDKTDAASLPYLQAVVKEAMRLHPVGPILLPHRAVEDGVQIAGYDVPKGSTVIFNAWAIMRDPAAWERPDEFVPERFLQDMAHQVGFRGKACEFIPFGSGRRLCPGLPLAERVVPFILASLLHAFEWRLPDGVTAEEVDVSERFTTANVLAVPLRAVRCLLVT